MARLVRLSTMAVRLTALAVTFQQASRTQITQVGELPFQALALNFEFGHRCGHGTSFYLTVYITVRWKASPLTHHASPESNQISRRAPVTLSQLDNLPL